MKTFKQLINERISQNLYHGTYYDNALNILKKDFFILSKGGHGLEQKLNYGYDNFLSTTRTINSKYIKQLLEEYDNVVIFSLDGKEISNNYRTAPVDFFAGTYVKVQGRSESEERILSNNTHISVHPYVNACYLIGSYDKEFIELIKNYEFPVWKFNNITDFLNLNLSKAEPLMNIY